MLQENNVRWETHSLSMIRSKEKPTKASLIARNTSNPLFSLDSDACADSVAALEVVRFRG